MLKVTSAGLSDVGRKRRHNEDAFLSVEDLGLFVVADGLGGHASGEVASNEAVDAIHGWILRERGVLEQLIAEPEDPDVLERGRRVLEQAIMAATYHVFAMAEADTSKAGMGTTISALVLAGGVGVLAQVGDSRIYRVRGDEVSQLTDDHTLVAMQIRDGTLTPEEARRAPHRNVITRAVGSHEYVQVDTAAVAVFPGDRFLLCTDGLHGYLSVEEVAAYLRRAPDVAARDLVDLANNRGGKDNITALVVAVD